MLPKEFKELTLPITSHVSNTVVFFKLKIYVVISPPVISFCSSVIYQLKMFNLIVSSVKGAVSVEGFSGSGKWMIEKFSM